MSLKSRVVAITRGPRDAAEFVDAVEGEGGRALALPTIRLVGRTEGISATFLEESRSYDPDYTILMSSRAVRLLMDDAIVHHTAHEVQLAITNSVVVAVGPKTAAALEAYGIRVNLMPDSVYSSVGVGEVMSRMDRSHNRVLVPRSGASTPFLKDLLNKEGFDVHETHLYDVKPHSRGQVWDDFMEMLRAGGIHGVVFTSASSVRAFFEIVGPVTDVPLDDVAVVSIGPFTSVELEKLGIAHHTSEVHTVAGSLDVLRRVI